MLLIFHISCILSKSLHFIWKLSKMDQTPLWYFINFGGVTPLLWCAMLSNTQPQTPLSNASILSRKNTLQVKNSHRHLIINCALIGCHKFICPFIWNNDSLELLWLPASMSNEFDFNAKTLEQRCCYSWGGWRKSSCGGSGRMEKLQSSSISKHDYFTPEKT